MQIRAVAAATAGPEGDEPLIAATIAPPSGPAWARRGWRLHAADRRQLRHDRRAASQAALAPRADRGFATMEAAIRSRGGADASGFELLDRKEDGLRWRLVLIDTARHSVDAQYYLWHGDAAGGLLLKYMLDAAGRGRAGELAG